MRIDIWSDVVCPFCYIGKRKLEMALAETRISADIEWHSFELDPDAPPLIKRSLADVLAEKYGFTAAQALAFLESEQRAAAEVGLEFNLADIKRGNTFNAHRLIQLAKTLGLATAVKERFLRAYFTEGAQIGSPPVLGELAIQAGLPEDAVASVLNSHAFGAEVRADERRAGELGIHAVPHFIINGRSAIVGARPVPDFVEALLAERETQSTSAN